MQTQTLESSLPSPTFWSHLRHEIKTPLTSLRNLPHLLEWEKLEGDNKEFLEDSFQAAQELGQTVDRIFEAWQLETEGVTINPIATPWKAIFEKLKTPDNLTITIIGDTNFKIKADPVLLPKALQEIIHNAGFFNAQKKPELKIQVSKFNILFQDNGIGIDPDHWNHVFDMLFVVSQSRNRTECGPGAGLAIVRNIITAHNGSIQIIKSSPKGTTWEITL